MEVKASLCNFTANQILREMKVWRIQTIQKCHFGNFRDSELWILVNLGLESCSNVLKSKFRTSKIVNINIFGPFAFTKIWFHVKSEWQENHQISTKSSLNFTFWKFLEHSVTDIFLISCTDLGSLFRNFDCAYCTVQKFNNFSCHSNFMWNQFWLI